MRRALDSLYLASGILSAVFLVGIAVLILAQVAGRFADVLIPGVDDLVAWSTAATTFLGLPYTFARGGHVRVELVLSRVSGGGRRIAELVALAIALPLTGAFAWFSAEMVWESYVYGELSMGQLVVPLWIPQLGLAIGAVILLVAVVDSLATVIAGSVPAYLSAGDRAESGSPAVEV